MEFKDKAKFFETKLRSDETETIATPTEIGFQIVSVEATLEPGILPPKTMIDEQYEVVSTLGSGGMSHVYRCRDIVLDRMVAVKVLKLDPAINPQSLARFQSEGKAIARLNHQNIVKVYGLNIASSQRPILVMELIEGTCLAQLLTHGPLAPARAIKFVAQICDGLKEAHANGIIHRDLKPSNIMVINEGRNDEYIKILDFGIAKVQSDTSTNMTQTGEIFGTPTYMSPEQAFGKTVSEKTDQYSLGCVLFEMLTGTPPFRGDNNLTVLMQHVQEPPPSLTQRGKRKYPAGLEEVACRLLAKDPADRYADISQVKDAVLGAKQHQPPHNAELANAERERAPQSSSSHKKKVFYALTLMLVSLLTCLIAVLVIATQKAAYTKEDQDLQERLVSNPARIKLSQLPPHGLEMLSKDTNLELLDLTNVQLSNRQFAELAKLPAQILILDGTNVTDKSMRSVSKMPNLYWLSVAHTDISTKGVEELTSSPLLRILNLVGTKIDPRVFETLGRIKNLDDVDIAYGDDIIRDPAFAKLSKLHATLWNFSGEHLNDNDLAQIARFGSIQRLYLCDNPGITVNGLLQLGALPYLKYLNLKGCGFLEKDLAELRSRLAATGPPGRKIEVSDKQFLID